MAVRKAWVNPAHGTAGSRRALRAAANAAESSAFARAKPRAVNGAGRKKVWNLDASVAKSDSELPIVPRYAGRANFRSGTAAVGKRMTGASTGVAKPKKVQPPRVAGRQTPGAGMPTMPLVGSQSAQSGKPPIHPSLVGKADSERASRKTRLRRQYLYDERFGINPMNQQNKDWRSHWKTNLGHMGVGYAAGAGAGAGIQHLRGGGRSKLIGGLVGGYAGMLGGADVSRRKITGRMERAGQLRGPHSYPKKETASKGLRAKIIESSHDLGGDGNVLQTRIPGVVGRLRGQRRTVVGGHNLDPLGGTARPRASRKGEEFGETMYDRKSRLAKRARRYDPEDRRQRRVGAGAAALGLGGAALAVRGGRSLHRATQLERQIGHAAAGRLDFIDNPHYRLDRIMRNESGAIVNSKTEPFGDRHSAALEALRDQSGRMVSRPSRRQAQQIGGGAAMIGGGAALAHHARSRGNRRWD